MNSQVKHRYVMKQTLNREYDLIKRFWVQMGWVKDIVVDAYIMINGEKKDEDENGNVSHKL